MLLLLLLLFPSFESILDVLLRGFMPLLCGQASPIECSRRAARYALAMLVCLGEIKLRVLVATRLRRPQPPLHRFARRFRYSACSRL